ncbi:MAG: Sec-independent protein translocase protein TatB [Pseudomonadota bacterium]
MFDIGWQELIVIGVLALLVVGPKELPGLFRTVGQYVGKARRIAREFQRSMEDAARDADGGAFDSLRDAKRDFDKMSRVDFSEQAKRAQDSMMSGGKSAQGTTGGKATGKTSTTGATTGPAPSAAAANGADIATNGADTAAAPQAPVGETAEGPSKASEGQG